MSHRRVWTAARAALAAVLLLPVLVLVSPTAALACSCGALDTPTLVEHVDTVAVGELTAIDPPAQRPNGEVSSGDQVTYTATLRTVLKGDPGHPLVFSSASHGASCGLEGMVVGQEYVFFVRDGQSGLCDGTSVSTAQLIAEVEAVTGPGQAVSAPAATSTEAPQAAAQAASDSESDSVLWLGLAAGALALLAVGWLLWRRSSL